MEPEATSVTAPIVALTSMLARAPRKTIAIASRCRSSSRRNPTRRSRVTATTGASVLPTAVTTAANGLALIGRFTASAATATAGQ
jgi:hypothetical protein